jgi:adenylate cyclase
MGENRESSGNTAGSPAVVVPAAFGDVRFDTRTGELQRNGSMARLTPKAAAVLAALLERAPELVTKEELFARVWDGKAVGDEALTSCIQELRRALDDDARQPRYIETRHRRGYRLIVPLGAASEAPASNVPAPPGKPSLAVLPFDNLSGDRDQDYFADGIVEDMTTALSRIGAFFVVARGSSFTFKGRNVPAQEVGRQLGVRYIVEGSVRRAGQKLRLTVQLIDAESGHHLWADNFDGEMADVFDLQDRIVGRIVGAISPSVRAAEIARARLKRPESLQAYDYLLRAQPGFQSIVDPGHAEALKLFHKALELEPAYALAMAQAAWGHAQRFNRLMSADVAGDRRHAIELANAAIALAPDDPSVLVAAGQALLMAGLDGYTDRSAFLFRKVLELDPNSAPGWRRMGGLHVHRLEPAEAIEAFERALRLSPLDPMSFYARFGIGDAHLIVGRLEEALRFYQQALSERPRDHLLQRKVCALLAITGETEQARRMAREILAEYPHLTLALMASVSRPTPQREIIFKGLRLAGFP